jgi:MarR family transcriptional regulator, organic hydroperoxide resistance regulator
MNTSNEYRDIQRLTNSQPRISSVYLLPVEELRLKLGAEAEAIPGFLLWQVSKLWQRHLTLALQDLKLPSTQAVILANVLRFSEEGRPATQAMLSDAAKVDRMTASQSLRSLELKRYVTRTASPGDKRANRVVLTTEGRRVALETIARLAATHEKFFEPLAGETAAVVGWLQRLVQANKLT